MNITTKTNQAEIIIVSDSCWICDKPFNHDNSKPDGMTVHHAIPQRLKPKSNVTLPVCRLCHSLINKEDKAAVVGLLARVRKQLNLITSTVNNK